MESDKKQDILFRYFENKESSTQIARVLYVSSDSVLKVIRANGLLPRTPAEGVRLSITQGRRRCAPFIGASGPANLAWRGGKMTTKDGYIKVYDPDSKHRYTAEHRLVWERVNNRKLPKGWIIHHINGKPADNQYENLLAVPRNEHNTLKPALQRRIRELEVENRRLLRALEDSQLIFGVGRN